MELVVGASSEAVNSLVGKLGSLLAQEYTLIQGVRDDIQYINDELASMLAFLNRLKRGSSHDEQRQDWMKQVREVAYDIEDCIGDVSHRLDSEPRGSKLILLRRAWYVLTTLYARRDIATEIGNLKLRAQHVSDRRTRYAVEIIPKDDGSNPVETDAPRDVLSPTPQLIGTKEPVGIEGAMEEAKRWLDEGKHNPPQLRYFAIFGFGGLGKTTLAMAVYRKFGDDFDCRASVQASQKFNLLTLLRSLVKQFHEQQDGASENPVDGIEEWREDQLKRVLSGQLKATRYLILIDDIWSVSAWENIRDSLPKNEKGGAIVVTTRFKSVAEACRRQQGHFYEHKPLQEEKPYNLFRQIISSAPDGPTDGARAVLKKCGGLPLAIILVAGLVASKLNSDTKSTLDDHLVKLDLALSAELGNSLTSQGVTQILNHCYNDLPADLKTCLLYLSMFRKGFCVSRKCLIRRWIAEGFITEKHGKTIEEVSEDYFNELVSRNLIRPVNNSSNGKVKNYQVHDMVLEYIVSKSSDENFITVVGGHWQTPFPSYKVRRLSVHRSDPQHKETVERMKLSHVRSLTVSESFKVVHSCFLKFQILQVLDLEGCKDLSFHQLRSICKRHQLKYLSLRGTGIEKIPKEIGRLEYLEVLDIRETNVTKLPSSVERLERMAHLLTGNKSKRIALTLTEGITKMTALQTLSGIEICGSSGAAMAGSVREAAGARALDTAVGSPSADSPEYGDGARAPATAVGTPTPDSPEYGNGERTLATAVGTPTADTSKNGNGARTLATAVGTPTTDISKNGDVCSHSRRLERQFGRKATLRKVLRPLAALQNLTNLKKLSIYKLRNFNEKDDELLLLAAIEHLSSCSLKFLAIDDSFTGFLDRSLNSSQAPPEHLQTLELSGMLYRVPKWIGDLHNLEKLTLSLTSLTTDTWKILRELPELFSLIFSLYAENKEPSVFKILHTNTLESGGKIFVTAGGFKKLKLLRFSAPVLPPLSFLEGAMPELQRLEMKFRMVEGVYGLENLASLQQVFLTVSSQAPKDAKEKVSQIKGLASKIGNAPSVVSDEYNESSKEQ